MRYNKWQKAKWILDNNKINIDENTDNRVSYKAIYISSRNKETIHRITFDKTKMLWSCECKHWSIKMKNCSGIIAAKVMWFNEIKHIKD